MKSLDKRIHAVLTDATRLLKPTFGPAADRMQMAVIQKLNAMPGAQVQQIGGQLTMTGVSNAGIRTRLGNHKDYRQLARLYLLFEIVYGRKQQPQIQTLKNDLLSRRYHGNKSHILNLLQPYKHIQASAVGGFAYTGLGNDEDEARQQVAHAGYSDAKALLALIKARLQDDDTEELIDYWFGATSAEVGPKIGKLFTAMSTKTIRFKDVDEDKFGSAIRGAYDTYGDFTSHTISLGRSFWGGSSARRPTLVNFETAARDLDKGITTYLKYKSLEGGTGRYHRYQQRQRQKVYRKYTKTIHFASKISWAGTIIHELTHIILATHDVRVQSAMGQLPANKVVSTMGEHNRVHYGPYLCRHLAMVDPGTALTNADNYRLFCETFFQNVQ